MDTIIVNLFGAPGAGKSTMASQVFSELKTLGVNAELVNEYAKAKVWDESVQHFKNQMYIVAKQSFYLSRVYGKVDVIVTDSPILLGLYYCRDMPFHSEHLDHVWKDIHAQYDNMNYLLHRVKDYNPIGRFQNEEASNALGNRLYNLLNHHNIDYKIVDGSKAGGNIVIQEVCKRLGVNNEETKR